MELSEFEKAIAYQPVTWSCRFHPTDWWHEIGCPHQEWTNEQLRSALISKKKFEQSNLKGTILS